MGLLHAAQAAAHAAATTDLLSRTSIIYGFVVWFCMTVPLTWLARRTQPYASPALLSGLSVWFIVCAFQTVAVGGLVWQTGASHWLMMHLPYFGLAAVDGAAVACGVALANWLYDRHVRRLTRSLASASDAQAQTQAQVREQTQAQVREQAREHDRAGPPGGGEG